MWCQQADSCTLVPLAYTGPVTASPGPTALISHGYCEEHRTCLVKLSAGPGTRQGRPVLWENLTSVLQPFSSPHQKHKVTFL